MNTFALANDPLQDAANPELRVAIDKAMAGESLDFKDAKALYFGASLQTLGALAHAMRMRLHPEPIVTYVADRNINYSNICVCQCRFCAFCRTPGAHGAYVISREELAAKIDETIRLGGTQILLQGGHNPDLPFTWYEELLAWIRKNWPDIHIHAFSPPEIHFWSKKFNLSVVVIIKRLMAAGLDSIPGGGAEILYNGVRKKVSPNKCDTHEWLNVMRIAHKQGMRTTATMMFGHEEEPLHRLYHLFELRDLQYQTGGFTAFIPWTFQPAHTQIHVQPQPAPAYLRMLAVSRLVLDNFDNIQASWVTMGPEIAQLALFYGANDFGSLMIEENVVAAAGVSHHMSREDIHNVIRRAGFTPVQRRMDYTTLPIPKGEPLRMGRINFLNVLPIYHPLESGIIPHDYELVSGPPAVLNTMMAEGILQVSSCSCIEYARNYEHYYLVPDLSIGSLGPVLSVLLLSRLPIAELEGHEIVISGKSHTSVALLRLLMDEYYGVNVTYRAANVTAELRSDTPPVAFLAIGDEALRLRNVYPIRVDLAEAWRIWTGFPFVFGLWVISARAADSGLIRDDPGELLRRGRDWGLEHMDVILDLTSRGCPLSREELRDYYEKGLFFTLNPSQIAGLEFFYEKLRRALIIFQKPPLRFYKLKGN